MDSNRRLSIFQPISDDSAGLPDCMIARTVVEPEESAAEKIYATLRECREQADPKKQKGVKMQGYLVSHLFAFIQWWAILPWSFSRERTALNLL